MTDEQEKEQHEKPKIIVDDDWKSRVQEEKEALKEKAKEKGKEAAEGKPDEEEALQLPPASFAFLVSTIATQAMAALGQLPDPEKGEPVVRKELAKLHIDTLAVLAEKTKGNLQPDESKMLTDILHQLRMAYIGMGS